MLKVGSATLVVASMMDSVSLCLAKCLFDASFCINYYRPDKRRLLGLKSNAFDFGKTFGEV